MEAKTNGTLEETFRGRDVKRFIEIDDQIKWRR
jgi:hypothetical protein